MLDTFELPMEAVEAVTQSPKNLIIFSKPKVGKTSAVAQLPGCLLLDMEDGSDYVSAMKVKIESIKDLQIVGKKIIEAGKPYKFIAIDSITALEEKCIPYAESLYSKTPMGKSWFDKDGGKEKYGTITGLPNGAGYQYLREAFAKIMNYIKTLAPVIIQLGHVKDIVLDKNGVEVNALDLDLTGKLKRITAAQSDAIGYMYRKGDKNILSFKTTDEISCGARPDHLKNQEIVISETIDGKLITHWDKVFIDKGISN